MIQRYLDNLKFERRTGFAVRKNTNFLNLVKAGPKVLSAIFERLVIEADKSCLDDNYIKCLTALAEVIIGNDVVEDYEKYNLTEVSDTKVIAELWIAWAKRNNYMELNPELSIEKIIYSCGFYDISKLTIEPSLISFKCEDFSITYEKLNKLAAVFKTNEIRFEAETYTTGYCSTCSSEEIRYVITINNYEYPDSTK